MSLYKNKYRNESTRLKGWDYASPGYYFVTVCTHNRACLFGHIDNGEMVLNEYGKIVQDEWDKSFTIRRELVRDEFVVMPNHFHGIVKIDGAVVNPVGPHGPVGPVGMHGPVGTHGRASPQSQPSPQSPPPTPQPSQKHGVAYRAPKSVSSFMGGVKSAMTKRINQLRNTPGARVLQTRFHDHVIRNEKELFRIRKYIKNNPLNWETDKMRSCGKDARPCVPTGPADSITGPTDPKTGPTGPCGPKSVREISAPYGEEPWMV